MKEPYTARQGQFLAFIHHYITLHRRAPAEAELVDFFEVTPPTVHQMILTLERRRLINRVPGQARSISLRVPPETLPPLLKAGAAGRIAPSAPTSAQHDFSPADRATLFRLGEIQLADCFAHNAKDPIDDSDFLPLLNMLIETFAKAGLEAPAVQRLRLHACNLYHGYCREALPVSTFEENMKLMLGYLPSSLALAWRKALSL